MPKGKASKRGSVRVRNAPRGPVCDCASAMTPRLNKTGAGVGPGAHAVGVDLDIKAENLKHLRRIEGQVRGIAAMIEEQRYCADIIQQVAAVQESLRSVSKNLLKNHLRNCAVDAIVKGGNNRAQVIKEVLAIVAKIAR